MADPNPFLPSVNGFAFTNSWPSQPAVTVPTPFGTVNLGNAAAGLCGGMVFAALDFWHAQARPPAARPDQGAPLYDFLVRRLVDSWHVPAGVAQYYQWMNLPDDDASYDVFGRQVVIERGVISRTLGVQWPQIRADLDAGTPAALGLVTVASANPKDLGLNHQVLAHGYQHDGAAVTVAVYDPNSGPRDDVWIRFSTAGPNAAMAFEHNIGIGHPVRGFFRTAYAPTPPPGGQPSDSRTGSPPSSTRRARRVTAAKAPRRR
jgi:hypothetical protein